MKNKQFTCAVSMEVTEEQFNNDLRQPLIGLGYEIKCWSFKIYNCIVNNPSDTYGIICNYKSYPNQVYNRYLIEPYNPKLFLALASLTTESKETKEEVIARFENKIEERELIGYRFRNDDFNKMTCALVLGFVSHYTIFDGYHIVINAPAYRKLKSLNLLETFCEPVYKEATISIEEAESILRSIGRTEKIKNKL